MTTQPNLMLEFYRQCLQQRREVWFNDPRLVEASDHELRVQGLAFVFLPQRSLWELRSSAGSVAVGGFDRVTKTARKVWSGYLSLEEADLDTRTSGAKDCRDSG